MAGVSVRTLRHYESISLLRPSGRTEAGYRLYTDSDLLRLQQILLDRELGLPLEEIRRLLDDPQLDRPQRLLKQRELLLERARATQAMLRSIDAALAVLHEHLASGVSTMDMKQIFDGFDPTEYQQEAHERWGDTNAYQESARRTRAYSSEDWQRFKEESTSIMNEAASAFQAHCRPEDTMIMAVAERHRRMIDRWFYPCSHRMHAALADMYEADQRFAQNIDRYAAGLTSFWSEAIRANAARLGTDCANADSRS